MSNTINIKRIPAAIQSARTGHKMTRSALADAVGVSGQTIYRWERGTTKIPLKQAIRVSTILKMAISMECGQCRQKLTIREGSIEPAGARDLLGLLSAAYMVSDGLPCASVDDARRISEIANLLEAALDLIESTLPDMPNSLSVLFEE